VNFDPFDNTPNHHPLNLSADRFNFWKFRHRWGVRKLREPKIPTQVRKGEYQNQGRGRLYSGGSNPFGSEGVHKASPDAFHNGTRHGNMMTDPKLHQDDPAASASEVQNVFNRIRSEVQKVIVGQEDVIEEVLIAIFCGGHAIIEGVPGLAKTLLVHTLSSTLSLQFSRIQFTPDLMPSDMTGTEVIEEDKSTGQRNLRFVPGPIFANIILADEINRTPPKTQGALLEAMQERQVTAGGESHTLPSPFFVLATQNPIEQEGTYPLPEAQLDRFMFNIRVGYPTEEDELAIVQRTTTTDSASADQILSGEDCLRIQHLVRQVPVAPHVARYALRIVRSTRVRESLDDKPDIVRDYLSWGAGPRASQFLVLAAKAKALISGTSHVTPEHIRSVALPILRHRLITNFNAEADNISTDDIVNKLLEVTPVDESDTETRTTLDSVTR
jgi:MoxR-like ATPase